MSLLTVGDFSLYIDRNF